MGTIFVCGHPRDDGAADRRSSELQGRARAEGMRIQALTPLSWLASTGARDPDILRLGSWTLVGTVIDRRTPSALDCAEHSSRFDTSALSQVWGRFLGLRHDPPGGLVAAYRDPSGAIDCAVWTHDDLTFVGSDVPDWLIAELRPSWSIAWDRVALAAADPLKIEADLLLDGLTAVIPGTVQPLPSGPPCAIWRPDHFARRCSSVPTSEVESAARLRNAVEESVVGLAATGGRLAAEVSGGLDSSIVAACLKGSGLSVDLWLNAWGPEAAADERPFVAALADYLQLEVTCSPRTTGMLTRDRLEAMPQRLRPGLAAMDGFHDEDWASRLAGAGIESILTGKGGDAMFVQPASSLVYTDLWRSMGWRALFSPALPNLARWTERSVWSLVAQARGDRPTSPARAEAAGDLLTATPSNAPATHPWLCGVEDIAPAKTFQIAGLVNGLSFHGPSLQTAVVDVLHPLLAQPVVETCLGLSMTQLTRGRRDRGLARLAFSEALPLSITDRRSKGELTATYGRMIAGGLQDLRPWLLDGRLAAQGIVDRSRAEELLTRESLIWRGGYVEIMTAATFEGWIRAWERRLGRVR